MRCSYLVCVYIVRIMQGEIIVYHAHGKMSHQELNKLCQRLYGQDTSSHGGQYRYHRRGLLEDIPHRKLIRGVLLVWPEDAKLVVDFLRSYGAEVFMREVQLTEEDVSMLRKKPG